MRSVTHYEISGLSFTPSPVWLDGDLELFAQGSEWMMIIREGWESAAGTLLAAQSQRTDTLQGTWARALARKPKGPLVFTHCRLFDAPTARTIPDTTIVVSANRIARVGRDGGVTIPENAEVIDATGKTIVPGLWDMHVHLGFETAGLLNLAGWRPGAALCRLLRHAARSGRRDVALGLVPRAMGVAAHTDQRDDDARRQYLFRP